jgi:glucan phosphoethanolaminetransferase (alkaline phosphatase superfamily)
LSGTTTSWLRGLARHRKQRIVVVLLLPALLVVVADLSMRAGRLAAFPPKYLGSYVISIVESAVLWAVMLVAASARRGAVRWLAAAAFVTLATIAVGSQLYFHAQYATYLNLDATLWGRDMSDSTFGQLTADSTHFLTSVAPPLIGAVALVWLGRKLVRTRARVARLFGALLPAALVGALLIPCSYRSVQGSTPDIIYFHAMGGLLKHLSGIEQRREIRPKRRSPPALPKITPTRTNNVIFLLTESIRADLGCPAYVDECPAMPFSNAAMPSRLPLFQMRSNSSTTAIQLAVLWTGLEPNAGREPLHAAPVVFDFADAAGYHAAYWSSHHMMFANSRLWVQDLPTTFQCGATRLDPLADIDTGADDRLLTARVKEELPQLAEPFFAVVHYGNTHTPYLVDPDDSPFAPSSPSKDPADNEAYRNHYTNAVHRQDKTVGELLRFIQTLPSAERTVVIYTSDHGEQFREHGQVGHTGSVFDVEIHVPAWVDAPGDTLNDAERSALETYAAAPTFHTDITPTILDLLGIWDAAEVAAYRAHMVGGSLLRPVASRREKDPILAMTNCAGVWGCAFENWGVMQGRRKLFAREWDQTWLCYDTEADPKELDPLPIEQCEELRREAETLYRHLPGKG